MENVIHFIIVLTFNCYFLPTFNSYVGTLSMSSDIANVKLRKCYFIIKLFILFKNYLYELDSEGQR